MALNDRETKLLFGLAAILFTGGLVRLVATRWPELTPGVVVDPASAGAEPSAAGFSGPRDLDSLFVDGRLNVNTAGPDHLVLLPGIGPALAARVVDLRRERGRFTRVEDLLMVRGIGPKTLERLRPLVALE